MLMQSRGRSKMEVGIVGLGRMGSRLASRLVNAGYSVVGYDKDNAALSNTSGIRKAVSLQDLAVQTAPRRLLFLMVPAGVVDAALGEIVPYLTKNDVIVDAGNSFYKDSIRRAEELKAKGIFYLDSGTSGGLEGALNGASFTVGGEKSAFDFALPAFTAMAAKNGVYYVGKSGSGHFVKMVHNAIEYGILEAYAEGFALLKREHEIDLAQVSRAWGHGSVIRSWILELAARCLKRDAELLQYNGKIGGGESGGWAIQEAMGRGVDFPSIIAAFDARKKSMHAPSFASKLIAALRDEFGGHKEPK